MADWTRAVGDVNRNCEGCAFALGAIARLSTDGGAAAVEDHFGAKVGVDDAAVCASEAREDAFAFAAQVFDCFEEIAGARASSNTHRSNPDQVQNGTASKRSRTC